MGWMPTWLGGSAKKSSGSANPVSQAPDRASRVKCWEARDRFFECLDKNNIIDSIEEDAKARKQCAPELQDFEQQCIASWVSLPLEHPECWLSGYCAPIFHHYKC